MLSECYCVVYEVEDASQRRQEDVRGRDVAAGQLLGYRTRAESYACPVALKGYQALDVSTVTGCIAAPCV